MKKVLIDNIKLLMAFCILLIIGVVLCLFKIKNVPIVLFSAAANLFLIIIIRAIIKKFKIKWTKKEKIVIISSIVLLLLFYTISVLSRKFLYFWDYACYYDLQIKVEQYFNTGLRAGISSLINSTWSGEYGNFITFFSEFPFAFTNKSIDSYVLSNALVFIPYLIISLSILLKRVIDILDVHKKELMFLIGILTFSLFPIVHASFIFGQPDVLGLVFVFLIISLTLDCDFSNVEYDRMVEIGIITYMLLISRRWYMYFILVYYVCYGITIIILNIKNKKKIRKILKHLLFYIVVIGLLFGTTLFPLFKKIITEGFSYDFYLKGGLLWELGNQINRLGLFHFVIILIGIVYTLVVKKYRKYGINLVIHYFVIVLMFLRIQNMGLHHTLLFVYIYLFFTIMFFEFISNRKIVLVISIIILTTNFFFAMFRVDSKIFTSIQLTASEQGNYDKLIEVGNWLEQELQNENAYMITHNRMYNPDKFRNMFLPDETIKKHLPYGSAVFGVHYFPIQLFEARYVITTTPFDNYSMEEKYNDVFKDLVKNKVFELVKKFDMCNGYTILIYERAKAVTVKEADMYLNVLTDESIKYPYLYRDVIVKYKEDKLIKD